MSNAVEPLRLVLFAVLFALSACSLRAPDAPLATAPESSSPAPIDAVALYASFCAQCHEGSVPKAPHAISFQMIGPDAIHDAMTQGVMRSQAAMLDAAEKAALAEYLGGARLTTAAAQAAPVYCEGSGSVFDGNLPPRFESWGLTLESTRFIAADIATLSAAEVPRLALEWAFAYPGATRARSQPAVGGGAIFVGSQDGSVYSLDFDSGCINWRFRADAEVRVAPALATPSPRVVRPYVFFGDFIGQVYAVEAASGELVWKTRVSAHPHATITGSPRYYDGRLFVPVSSSEWAAAADPAYECCTFRGAVVALDAESGARLWRTHSIAQEPRLTGETTTAGTRRWHPAGAPIWNSPTIDVERRRLYVGTGQAYTSPAAATSDAVLAMDLDTGELLWTYQSLAGDAWNMTCFIGGGPNCPEENGPDLDIGAPPVLIKQAAAKDILVTGQKSADVFALDPDDGALLWRRQTGRGGLAGGVHWGLAAQGTRVYAPSADTLFLPSDAERGEARPGLFTLEANTGETLWFTPVADHCPPALKPACDPGLSAPVTAIPGVVFAGGYDGMLRAFDGRSGEVIWQHDTNREYASLSGAPARGGSIESAGPVVADGALLVNSGYLFGGRLPGNVLLKFSVPAAAAP